MPRFHEYANADETPSAGRGEPVRQALEDREEHGVIETDAAHQADRGQPGVKAEERLECCRCCIIKRFCYSIVI